MEACDQGGSYPIRTPIPGDSVYRTTDRAGHGQRAALFHDDVMQGFTVAGRRFKRAQSINQSCAFQIPLNGMHTFYSSNHRIEWYVTARIEMPWWRDYLWQRQLIVLPEPGRVTDG
jgi:hypothetical protein